MRHVRTDEHQISSLKQLDVIRDETRARTFLDQRHLARAVIVPAVAMTLHRLGYAVPHDAHLAQAFRPSQKPECFVCCEADIFLFDRHSGTIGFQKPKGKTGK